MVALIANMLNQLCFQHTYKNLNGITMAYFKIHKNVVGEYLQYPVQYPVNTTYNNKQVSKERMANVVSSKIGRF